QSLRVLPGPWHRLAHRDRLGDFAPLHAVPYDGHCHLSVALFVPAEVLLHVSRDLSGWAGLAASTPVALLSVRACGAEKSGETWAPPWYFKGISSEKKNLFLFLLLN